MAKTINQLTARTGLDPALAVEVDDGNDAADSEKLALSFLALATAAGADADTTMAVGKLYAVDMSAWATADRTYQLPATAKVDERIGIAITAGSAAHELIVMANGDDSPSPTLNGVPGGTEWSRLFIAGEMLVLRCVVEDEAWVVEQDGRIPCLGRMVDDAGTSNHYPSATSTVPDFSNGSSVIDVGDIVDLTNERINVRRSGRYTISIHANTNPNTLSNGVLLLGAIRRDVAGTPTTVRVTRDRHGGADYSTIGTAMLVDLTAPDALDVSIYHNQGSTLTWAASQIYGPQIEVREELSR